MKHTHRLKPLEQVFQVEPEFDLAACNIILHVGEANAAGEFVVTERIHLGGENDSQISETVSDKKASHSRTKK